MSRTKQKIILFGAILAIGVVVGLAALAFGLDEATADWIALGLVVLLVPVGVPFAFGRERPRVRSPWQQSQNFGVMQAGKPAIQTKYGPRGVAVVVYFNARKVQGSHIWHDHHVTDLELSVATYGTGGWDAPLLHGGEKPTISIR